jgi:hypothetical protein
MKIQKLFLFLGLIVFLFGSCTKSELNNESSKSKPLAFCNQFDSIGISHNIGLKYAMSHMSKSTSTVSLQDTYASVVEGLEAAGISGIWPTCYFVETVWSPIDHNIVIDSNYSIAVCATQLYGNGTINSVQLDLFLQLNNIVAQNFGLPSYATCIAAFESNLNANASLTSSQKNLLLIGSSVAKYSGAYWASQMSSLKSTQYKWWQWGLIIGADVGGAIAGSSGGPAGSIGASACCSAMAMAVCSEDGGK